VAFLGRGVVSNSDQGVRQALLPLAELAARQECAVELVRHLNKRSGGRAVYRGGGSIGFLGMCRSGWLAARDPHVSERCVLAQVKNNLAAPQPSLAYRVDAAQDGPPRVWSLPCPDYAAFSPAELAS